MLKRQHKVKINTTEEKMHTSMFLLTLNSNTEGENKKFKKDIENVLNNFTDYISTRVNNHADNEMDIDLSPIFEVGTKVHRLHAHIKVVIKHNSNILIDTRKLQSEYPNYYINSTYIKGSGDFNRVLKYIQKNQIPKV